MENHEISMKKIKINNIKVPALPEPPEIVKFVCIYAYDTMLVVVLLKQFSPIYSWFSAAVEWLQPMPVWGGRNIDLYETRRVPTWLLPPNHQSCQPLGPSGGVL